MSGGRKIILHIGLPKTGTDFESAVAGGDGIVGAFAGLSGLSGKFLASRTERRNESLSLEATRVLAALNRQRPMFVDNVRAPRRAGPGRELSYISRTKGRSSPCQTK